jgi:cell division protein FtsN
MSAISHATTRKTPGGGGFLLGIFVGLLVGLAIALGIALYLNKTPIPFMSRKPAADDAKAGAKPPALAGMPQGGTAPAAGPAPKAPAGKAPEKPPRPPPRVNRRRARTFISSRRAPSRTRRMPTTRRRASRFSASNPTSSRRACPTREPGTAYASGRTQRLTS